MNGVECPREHEVVAAVLGGGWPDGCDAELRAHATSCVVCQDVVAIAPSLRADRQACSDVQLPAAGQIWWRSAIRARAESARAAARPMVWLQAITGAGAAGLAFAAVSAAWPRMDAVARFVPFTAASLHEALPLLLAAGIGVVAAPLVYYFAVPRD